MNNLKRVLSLGLTGAMLAGLLTVGASAVEFTDADKIAHDDAVNTLVALKIVDGKPDGSFDPEGDVTRAEMAKMIAVAMNGGNKTNTGTKLNPSFTDIAGHWAESEIEYCHDLGIISGRGDGTFDPGANVTGLEATKMVLTALGYKSQAYQLTGAAWAVNTDELARKASPTLYEGLETVMMASNASRDTAAQLIWNGLQNNTRIVNPGENKNNGEVSWSYVDSENTLLEERYGATVWVGTYKANDDSDSTVDDGCIKLINAGNIKTDENDRDATVTFASDLGIENIGEQVKVVYKDVNGGTPNRPDKKDTVYGVFNTGVTEVYKITKSDLQDSESSSKIKFNGSKYELSAASIPTVTDYTTDGTANVATINTTWRGEKNVDEIKFTCNTDGKIDGAYVTLVKAGKVTSVTSSKVTVSGAGTFEIDKNDVYEGIAKDDVVVYTRYYNATDASKAYFTVTKAETAEGKLEGYKNDSGKHVNVTVDGTTYKVNGEPTTGAIADLTDDAIRNPGADCKIGDTVKVYLAGGKVVAIQAMEQTGGKYALIIDSDTDSGATGNRIDSKLNPYRITVLLPDATEKTVVIDKNSTLNGNTPATKVEPGTDEGKFKKDVLVEYTSINDTSIKIKNVVTGLNTGAADVSGVATPDKYNGTGLVTVPQATDSTHPGTKEIWNKDTKKLLYNGTTSTTAAADAVLFVKTTGASGTKYNAYNLRDLGVFSLENNDTGATANKPVAVFLNSDGLVTAAYVELPAKPVSDSADTLYGIVTAVDGQVADPTDKDNTVWAYKIAVGRDEDLVVYVDDANKTLSAKDVVKFDEKTSTVYEAGDFVKFAATANSAEKMSAPVAVKSFDEKVNLLSFYTATEKADVNSAFAGKGAVGTETVDKDVKIIYVNAKDGKAGDEVGVQEFNPDNGYANAVYHTNSKGLVDVIIVETSREKNILANETLNTFGTKVEATLPAAPTATTAADNGGVYEVTMSPAAGTAVTKGGTVTITIKCTTKPDAAETFTLTGSGIANISGTATFDATGEKTITFTVDGDSVTLDAMTGVK